MEIKISNTKKIISDNFSYIYCEKMKTQKGKNKGKIVWNHKWYYNTMYQCYNDLLEELTRIGDKKTLKENLEETVEMLEELKLSVK